MSSSKQAKKQTKREKKAAKEAAREAARQREARRNRITAVVVAAIVLVGGSVAGATVWQEQRQEAALEAEREELEAEAAEQEEAIEARSVACGAEEPPGAGQDEEPYEGPPGDVLEEGVEYEAVVQTSCGELVLDLHADAAPQTVNNFVFLAEDGFFDGREIFRNATTIAALQTGSGTDDASWDLGYTVPGELELAEREGYPPGSVAMANPGDPDEAGSQFFFVYGEEFDEAFADNRVYTRFADVVEGLDVLTEIGELGTIGDEQGLPGYEVPAERVYIESVEIVAAD